MIERIRSKEPPMAAKSRVYDTGFPHVYGTIKTLGEQVSEVKWDQPTPWGAMSNTQNKHLRLVKEELGIPTFLQVKNRKPLTAEQKAKLVAAGIQPETVGKKRDYTLPENIEPAGLSILNGMDKPRPEKQPAAPKKEKGPKGPGVIATVIATITRPSGASIAEIVAVLKDTFPERQVKSMTSTAKIQSKKNATSIKVDAKRGKVFYRKEGK